MGSELIERLRDDELSGPMQHLRSWQEIDSLFIEAADEIERLAARVKELEESIADLEDRLERSIEREDKAKEQALREARLAIYQNVKSEDSAGRITDSVEDARRHDIRAGAFEDAMRFMDSLIEKEKAE